MARGRAAEREAEGLPEAFSTAHDALFTQAGLGPGERVCVHGAAGGVGTAGVQLATAVGARIVATVHHPALRTDVEALGPGVRAVDPHGFGGLGPFDVVLEQAAEAYARFAAGSKLGRIVLAVDA